MADISTILIFTWNLEFFNWQLISSGSLCSFSRKCLITYANQTNHSLSLVLSSKNSMKKALVQPTTQLHRVLFLETTIVLCYVHIRSALWMLLISSHRILRFLLRLSFNKVNNFNCFMKDILK